MPNFRISDVRADGGQLCVDVEHFHPATGLHWHFERYLWQGREGLKRKITLDADGWPLMDDGRRATKRLEFTTPRGTEFEDVDNLGAETAVRSERAQLGEEYEGYIYILPADRDWMRDPPPYMDNDSIFTNINAIHVRRVSDPDKWDGVDNRGRIKPSTNQLDHDGVATLLGRFSALVGVEQ